MASQANKLNLLSQRQGSFVASTNLGAASTAAINASKQSDLVSTLMFGSGEETKMGASTFYITNDGTGGSGGGTNSQTTNQNQAKFAASLSVQNPNGSQTNDQVDLLSVPNTNDEQNSSGLVANKSYNALDRNMVRIFLVFFFIIYFFRF